MDILKPNNTTLARHVIYIY